MRSHCDTVPKAAAGDLSGLLAPASDDLLELRKVPALVNRVKNERLEMANRFELVLRQVLPDIRSKKEPEY